jgi:hypothetical protein
MGSSNNVCQAKSHILDFSTNVYLHVVILFTILGMLYIKLISKVTADAVNHEISDLATDSIDKFYDTLSPENKNNVKLVLKTLPLDRVSNVFSEEDKVRKYNNENVFRAIRMTIVLFIIILLIVIAVSKLLCHNIPMKHLLIENIVIFFFVGIVEFSFFKYIILKYIPVEPSFITTYMLQKLKSYF